MKNNPIINTDEMILYICDMIKDQNVPNNKYYLIKNSVDRDNLEKDTENIVSINDIFIKLQEKFGSRNYRTYFIDHFLKKSTSSKDEFSDFHFESNTIEDLIAFSVFLDRLLSLYRTDKVEDKIYLTGFTVRNPNNTSERYEKFLLYNDSFIDSDRGDESEEDERMMDSLVNRNICLSDCIEACGVVKNQFKLFFKLVFKRLMGDEDWDTYGTYELPFCFKVDWCVPREVLLYLRHPVDYLIMDIEYPNLMIDITF